MMFLVMKNIPSYKMYTLNFEACDFELCPANWPFRGSFAERLGHLKSPSLQKGTNVATPQVSISIF